MIMNLFKPSGPDINEVVKKYRETEGTFLVDIRMPDEYAQGHIPGSINIPLNQIALVEGTIADKSAPVFVYCLSGGRSSRAAKFLEKIGYTDVTDLGGISGYKGPLEK